MCTYMYVYIPAAEAGSWRHTLTHIHPLAYPHTPTLTHPNVHTAEAEGDQYQYMASVGGERDSRAQALPLTAAAAALLKGTRTHTHAQLSWTVTRWS